MPEPSARKQLQTARALGAQTAASVDLGRTPAGTPARTSEGSTPSTLLLGWEGPLASVTAARPALERPALPACCHSLTCVHTHTLCTHTRHIYTQHIHHRHTHTPSLGCAAPHLCGCLPWGTEGDGPCSHGPLEPAGARGSRVHTLCSSTPQPQTHRQGGGHLRRCLPENLFPKEPETCPPQQPPPCELHTLCRATGRLQRGLPGSSVAHFGLPSCPPPWGAEGSGDMKLKHDSGPGGE